MTKAKRPALAAKPKRRWKTVTLSESLGRLTRDLCASQGFAQAEIITRWRSIAGPLLAAHSVPERLSFPKGQDSGTLYISADSAFALELQHLTPQVMERINGYFGFPAVSRIAIRQVSGGMPGRRRRRVQVRRNPAAKTKAARLVSGLHDPQLRQALESLGELVIAGEPTAN